MPADALQGRKVVCLANVKPSKMRGVESQAMLLCAFAADGGSVEVLEPPASCEPGQRIVFEGHDHEPEKVLNPRKKVWEKLQPDFNTSGACEARFQALAFRTPHGPCRVASIASGTIK